MLLSKLFVVGKRTANATHFSMLSAVTNVLLSLEMFAVTAVILNVRMII